VYIRKLSKQNIVNVNSVLTVCSQRWQTPPPVPPSD